MALYPKAKLELIKPGANDPAIKAVGIVYHVAVSTSDDIRSVFTDGRGIESHFYVRFDGSVLQYRDTAFEADAQFAGNSFGTPRKGLISVETEGLGSGTWTAAQVTALKELTVWAAKTHGFKVVKATAWNSGGVGYHSQFIEWNTSNHSCPGPDRVKQFATVFVPWFPHAFDAPAVKPAPAPAPQPSPSDVLTTEAKKAVRKDIRGTDPTHTTRLARLRAALKLLCKIKTKG